MTKANHPSARWTRSHGFRRGSSGRRKANRGKVVYRSWWTARWRAWRLHRRDADLQPYACYWGDDYRDGETHPRHWHIGHLSENDVNDWWGY